MTYLIGVDEAGYGPNLGPLVVAATVWQVDDPDADLYDLLGEVITSKVSQERLAVADSKALYQPGKGLAQLERGVHAASIALHERGANTWTTLVDLLRADPEEYRTELPWHKDFNCPLPIDASADEVTELGRRLRSSCQSNGVQLHSTRARLVFPVEFNQMVAKYETKGAALSHVTLALVRCLYEKLAGEPVYVVCDKHGGRNRYGALLQHHFGDLQEDALINTHVESRAESRYSWGTDDSRVEFTFRTKGESFLPAALASMHAKYLRELSMKALNQFWCERVPDLKPTAGYPVDAKRFKVAIASMQQALGIADQILWRCR